MPTLIDCISRTVNTKSCFVTYLFFEVRRADFVRIDATSSRQAIRGLMRNWYNFLSQKLR
jgi:hypothetical protein